MAGSEISSVLDKLPTFLAAAVEQLSLSLGEQHPTVIEGRRIVESLRPVPDNAVLITEETLAAALNRAWPYRRNRPAGLGLSAALIIAALRADAEGQPRWSADSNRSRRR